MLIKMSMECTRQIRFQSQPPGQFQWADSSSLWCTWACSTPLPRPPAPCTQVLQWCCSRDAAAMVAQRIQVRWGLLGKVVVIGLVEHVWGWGGKPNIIPGKGPMSLPTPRAFLPGHKPRRWGLLPCSLPCDWAGTFCLSCPSYSLCWHLNRTAVFEHCLPIPSPPNSLQWTAETLPLGQNC